MAEQRDGKRDAQGRRIEWQGGYIRYDERGGERWYIAKMRDGVRYHFVAGANERAAYVEWDRFLRDPAGYRVGRDDGAVKPILLTAALREDYLDYCAKPEEEEGAGNTPLWVNRKRKILKWWQTKLVDERGRLLDLRRLSRDFIPTIIDGKRDEKTPERYLVEPTTDKRTKRNIIKRLYAWLRVKKRLLTAAEDPVIDLPVGKGRSSIMDAGIPKDRVPADHVKAVIALGEKQGSLYAHVLRVQAGTGGWHTTEMMRFVAGGSVEPLEPEELEEGCAAKLVCPKHKRGGEFRAKVTKTILESARILLDKVDRPEGCAVPGCDEPHVARYLCRKHYQQWLAGALGQVGNGGKEVGHHRFYRGNGHSASSFSCRNYEAWVHACCDELGIERFNPSWMRHTNATFAKNRGKSSAEVGARIGHALDSNMVDKFYAPRTAPPKMPTILDDVDEPKIQKAKPAQKSPAQEEVVAQLETLLAKLKTG